MISLKKLKIPPTELTVLSAPNQTRATLSKTVSPIIVYHKPMILSIPKAKIFCFLTEDPTHRSSLQSHGKVGTANGSSSDFYKNKVDNQVENNRLSTPVMKATASKPNSPPCGEETILSELLRCLAVRPSGLVEATGIEPVSENPFTQFSPGAVYLQSSLPSSKQTKARGGILFMHDR